MSDLDFVKEEIHRLPGLAEQKPKFGSALKFFFVRAGRAIKLIFTEKELITFALLQWVAIGLGYYLWVQMLGWIPEEVWRSTETSRHGSIADIVLLLWSFVIVGIVALPVGVLSACMGAVRFLRSQGRPSTIAACLQIVLPKVRPLWIFHWIDGWITVNQILDRLPKKRDRRTPAEKVLSEALYYAWKLGTIGMLPALLAGRGLIEAGKQSISLVRHKLSDTALLRVGYSSICWVVGIAAYIGTIIFFCVFDNLVPKGSAYSHVYTFYFWAGVPIVIAVGVIQLFLRPVYILSSCDIYSDYLQERNEPLMLPSPPSRIVISLVTFGVLCLIVAVVILYRYELGIMHMLATPYGQRYQPR